MKCTIWLTITISTFHTKHYFTIKQEEITLTSKSTEKESEMLTDEEIINNLLRKITSQIELDTRNMDQKTPNVKEIIC